MKKNEHFKQIKKLSIFYLIFGPFLGQIRVKNGPKIEFLRQNAVWSYFILNKEGLLGTLKQKSQNQFLEPKDPPPAPLNNDKQLR